MREFRSRLPTNNPYYDIPSIIVSTCILFYCIDEYFTDHGPNVVLSDYNSIATVNGQISCDSDIDDDNIDYDCVYGNIAIDLKRHIIYEWAIKILALIDENLGDEISIGICAKKKEAYEGNEAFGHHLNATKDTYHLLCCGESYGYDRSTRQYGDNWKTNDVIKMEFNTKNMTIKYHVNDKDYGIAYKTDKPYISVDSDNDNAVQILDFI